MTNALTRQYVLCHLYHRLAVSFFRSRFRRRVDAIDLARCPPFIAVVALVAVVDIITIIACDLAYGHDAHDDDDDD